LNFYPTKKNKNLDYGATFSADFDAYTTGALGEKSICIHSGIFCSQTHRYSSVVRCDYRLFVLLLEQASEFSFQIGLTLGRIAHG
jgi:hypothetical protein